MSYKAISWSYSKEVLQTKPPLKKTDFAVLRALCWCCNTLDHYPGDVICYPGTEKLCELTGLKAGAINLAKNRLKRAGLISWDRAPNFNAEHRKPNSYHINCKAVIDELAGNKADRELQERRQLLQEGGLLELEDSADEDKPFVPSLGPGDLYPRPYTSDLMKFFAYRNDRITIIEAGWISDAMEIIGNTAENQKELREFLHRCPKLEPLREALDRVRENVMHRRIKNRKQYCYKSFNQAIESRQKQESKQ